MKTVVLFTTVLFINQLWAQTIPSMSWERVVGVNPSPHFGSIAVRNDTHVVISGGRGADGNSLTLPPITTYNIATQSITEVPGAGNLAGIQTAYSSVAIIPPWVTTLPYSAYVMYGISSVTGLDTNILYGLRTTTGNWEPITTTGGVPIIRSMASTGTYLHNCLNAGTGCIVFQAGNSQTLGTAITGVFWVLWVHESPPRWNLPTTSGTGASTRHSHVAAVTPTGDKLVIFGGNGAGSGLSSDTYVMATAGWEDATVAESTNLAVSKTATQSSNGDTLGLASKGVDGSTDGTYANGKCTLTLSSTNPWWSVDLGSIQRIHYIRIWWRDDCCTDRNRAFKVYAGNVSTSYGANPEVVSPYTDSMYNPTVIPITTLARYVWIVLPGTNRILTVCEVQVYQRLSWRWRQLSGLSNLALNRPAFQSTNGVGLYDYGEPSLAVNNIFGSTTTETTRTQDNLFANRVPEPDVYWYVDLQSVRDVNYVKIWDGSTTADRGRNVEVYIGYNTMWQSNIRCWGPGDIYGAVGLVLDSCSGRGRYVHVRKVPSNCTSCANSGAYENQLMLQEVQVFAEQMLDQPTPRYGMGITTYGKYMVIFGGTDTYGYRLSDVRLLDLVNFQWLPPYAPLGTAPAARAYPVFITLPLGTAGASTLGSPVYPGNSILLFGGSGSIATLSDVAILRFATCPVLTDFNTQVLICQHGGTVCAYTCLPSFYDVNNQGYITCGPDGQWDGFVPMCKPTTAILPGRPILNTPVVNADNSVTISWTAGATGYGGTINGFRVASDPREWSQYFAANKDVSAWVFWAGPRNATLPSTYTFASNGWLALDGFAGTDFAQTVQTGTMLYRPFPTVPGLSVCTSSWSLEARIRFLPYTGKSPQNGQFAGIGIVDLSKNITYTGGVIPATQSIVLELMAGMRRNLGVQQPGWRNFNNVNFAAWYDSPIDDNYPALGGLASFYIRVDRDFPNRRFRSAFRYSASDLWSYSLWRNDTQVLRGINSTDATGRWCPNGASNLQIALVARSNPTDRSVYAEYEYISWKPMGCSTPGTVVETNSTMRTATVTGLTPSRNYGFTVAQNGYFGYGTPSLVSTSVSIPATVLSNTYNSSALIQVSIGKPCSQSSTITLGTAPNNRNLICATANDGTLAVPAWNLPTAYNYMQTTATDMLGAWFQIDLGWPTAVKELRIDNTDAGFTTNMDDFEVIISNTPQWLEGDLCDQAYLPQTITLNQNFTARFPCYAPSGSPAGLIGRYVTVKIAAARTLALREVTVFATNNCSKPRNSFNGVQVPGTNCAANAPYGAVCVHECPANYVRTGGNGASTCNGDSWNYPELVCEPVCPDLPPPLYAATCTQSLYTESFDDNRNGTLGSAWLTLDGTSQGLNPNMWFIINNGVQVNVGMGCGNEQYAVLSGSQYYSYRGSFTFQATIRTEGQAGLIFRVQDRDNLYRYNYDVRSSQHSLVRVFKGQERTLTDSTLKVPSDSTHTIRIDSMSTGEITIYFNGRIVLYTFDMTYTSGTVGLYASTFAQFDDVKLLGDCTSCSGASNQDTCTFTCNSGMKAVGPTTRTCVVSGGGIASWFPSTNTDPLDCTLDPPTFRNDVRAVAENSARNTLVGDPVAASLSSPDYSLQFAIVSGNINEAFYVDSCSGQIKVRNAVLNYELIPSYLLTLKAFVVGFANVETLANITVNILDVNEPPIVESLVYSVSENVTLGAYVGNIRAWDPENDTLIFTMVTDGSAGAVNLTSTGNFFVSNNKAIVTTVFDFEGASAGNPFSLAVRATEAVRGTINPNLGVQGTPLSATGTETIRILDSNDAPFIAINQLLTLREVDTISATYPLAFATVSVIDQDVGIYASSLTYSICGGPTISSGSSTQLFSISSSTPVLSITNSPTPSFSSMTAFPTTDQDLARALYSVCIKATDGFGASIQQNVTVKVSANLPVQPYVIDYTLPSSYSSTYLSTSGGEMIKLNGTNFLTIYKYELRFTNVNENIAFSTPCTVSIVSTELTCITPPGAGVNLLLTLYTDRNLGWELAPWRTTALVVDYTAFTVTNVGGNTNAPTVGGSIFSLFGTSFGPQNGTTGLRPTVVFGNDLSSLTSICGVNAPSSLSVAQVQIDCILPAGAGRSLTWKLIIGGRSVTSNVVNDAFAISYAPPTLVTVTKGNNLFNLTKIDTAGGQPLIITGTNFGPTSSTLQLRYASPLLVSVYTAPCNRRVGAQEHNTIDCFTVPGVGADLAFTIIVNGQSSGATPSAGTVTYDKPIIQSSAGLSYNAITGPGASNAPTPGGALVRIEGINFGPVGHGDIEYVRYGNPWKDNVYRYDAVNCAVTQAPPQSSIITCQLAPGIGVGHAWILSVGGQETPIYYGNTSYAPPRIADFTGAGAADADTIGNEIVYINGANFGPVDIYSANLLYVAYGTKIDNGPVPALSYTNITCSVTTAHTQISCFTAEGAGKALAWKVILDGQESAQPTTAYAAPVIDTITLRNPQGQIVSYANVDGGTKASLNGKFFGPTIYKNSNASLIQSVRYGPSGTEYLVPTNLWTAISHTQIDVTLLPGIGSNLKFTVAVADQLSLPSATGFSYAIPTIVQIIPPTANTYSDPRNPISLVIITRNMPFNDPTSRISFSLGNGKYARTLRANIPLGNESLSAAINADGTYNVTVFLPTDGAGQELAVQAIITTASATGTGGVKATSVVDANSLFSYENPVITEVIVTRARFIDNSTIIDPNATITNLDEIPCPFPSGDPVWSCTNGNVYQITFIGKNFAASTSRDDGVTRKLEMLLFNDSIVGETWSTQTIILYSWNHDRIVGFATRTSATIRLSITSQAYSGSTTVQTLTRTFTQASPEISNLQGEISDIPTTGGKTYFEIEVSNLLSGGSAEVIVGGRTATILYSPSPSLQAYIANALSLVPSNSPITLRVVAPPGQGTDVSVQVIRISPTNEREGSNTGFVVSYAEPLIDLVEIVSSNNAVTSSATITYPLSEWYWYSVSAPTDGTSLVRFTGTNLGISPTFNIADGFVLSVAQGTLHECPGKNGTHTCYQGFVPAGEGSGYDLPEYTDDGFTILFSAGNQDGPMIHFRYDQPVISSIVRIDGTTTDPFPTRGNVGIKITGKNFGERRANRKDSVVTVKFGEYYWDWSGNNLDCLDVVRVSHYVITCTLPVGGGNNLNIFVTVAGIVSGWWNTPTKLSYNKPVISNITSSYGYYPGSTRVLSGKATGGDTITIIGKDLGKLSSKNCAFLSWLGRSDDTLRLADHACDDQENFLGEGEISSMNVLEWDHEKIVFITPPGLGNKEILLSVRGGTLGLARTDANTKLFTYAPPVITSITPTVLDTEGGEELIVQGEGFGITPRDMSDVTNRLTEIFSTSYITLDDAPTIPTAYIVIVSHRSCSSNGLDIFGNRPHIAFDTWFGSKFMDTCETSVLLQTNDTLKLLSTSGVGLNRSLTVIVVDSGVVPGGISQIVSSPYYFSYKPPFITGYDPNLLYVSTSRDGSTMKGTFDISGTSFGNEELADIQGWTLAERSLDGYVSNIQCSEMKRRRQNGTTILSCTLPTNDVKVGRRNVTINVAGQNGFKDDISDGALKVVCAYGSYAHVGETCLPCPAYNEDPAKRGAECPGYVGTFTNFNDRFRYPHPLKGWYNLNSSDAYVLKWAPDATMMDACPEGFQDHGRDVCIVPCDPPESCLGDNHCAYGYTSKPPMWRCASCDNGFYKRAGECIKCPDSPAGLFIGFAILVVFVASVGFILNKKQVNIAVISIGVDFFQVLAIFSQSRIKWPPVVKELLHVLSAFNLNIEIVAPECLIPNVSYQQKFWFIMLLPLCVGMLLLTLFFALAFNKAFIKGREKKKWFTHKPTLVSSTLVLLYMLYLYLTRTVLDVFNCTPTSPPDGYTYLQVVFERCGVPGGTQLTLLPYAIAGLIIYTIGYPIYIGVVLYLNRELVMEDQLLRAKGVGNDRLTNPHAYEFRKQYGRAYFQFKPDWCMWIIMIILRKFFIALTAVIFNKNAAFQMAACLLVMFIAYSLQMIVRPYLSPGDFEEVLRNHMEASYTSAIHARLRAAIANIETRGRKKVRKNLLNFEGQIDRRAVLGILSGWLFNYNTVEQLMTFAAVIVCLMGIMYQANEVNTYYPESKDSVTAVVLTVIIVAIIYFFTVLITEIVVLYNEQANMRLAARNLARKNSTTDKGTTSNRKNSGSSGKLVGEDGEINTGKVDSQMNPMFMSKSGDSITSGAIGIDAILAQRNPTPELWILVQQGYADIHKQLEQANEHLANAKKEIQRLSDGNDLSRKGTNDGDDTPRARNKRSFAPRTTESEDSSSNKGLNVFRKNATPALGSLRK